MNPHYKKILAILATLRPDVTEWSDTVLDALHENGINYSRSRVHGWGVSPASKNYRHMTSDELLDVLESVYLWLQK